METTKKGPLDNWVAMLEYVMGVKDPKVLAALLRKEQKGLNRKSFVRRIWFRLNHLKHMREKPTWTPKKANA